MLTIRRTGPSILDMANSMKDIPARVMPYAAAIALTQAAKDGQSAVIAQMRVSFKNPVAYTLRSTRIEIATKDKLFARIAVKDQRGGGTRPESYLLPEVEGGKRSLTGIETALRNAGHLRSGEWAIRQSSSLLGHSGAYVSGAKVRSILSELGKPGSRFFVGTAGKTRTRALWERGNHVGGRTGKKQTRSIRALYVFTSSAPTYNPLLDFVGAAADAVRANFKTNFYAAAQKLTVRFG